MTNEVSYRIRNRTGQQITAAAPEASVWVSANAGTGKTGVLVDRISRLLLAGVEPERILCLTFTKAAAAEMANRLAELLGRWSAMPDDVLTMELRALGENPVDDELLARARRLFAMTLEAPEGLRIRTIHAFCESLLGRFPLEADISPDFRVMDDRDQREMQLQARDTLLVEATARGTDLARALTDVAALVNEEQFAGLMKELDGTRTRFRNALAAHGGADGLAAAVYRALGVEPGTTADQVILDASDIDAGTHAMLERLCTAWDEGAATNNGFARNARQWLNMPLEKRADCWRKLYASIFLKQDGDLKADSTLMSKGALSFDADALPLAHELGNRCIATRDLLKAINVAAATGALIRVGAALIDAYEGIKQRHGRLDYDDLIQHASRLLSSKSGVSWVHFKLDGGIEHVLVDEAQDTSPDQWQVIEEIASDFFSGQSRYEETAERPRTVFAVGDEKQSIYSFQGADPVMFGTMRNRFGDQVTTIGQTWKPVDMAESFRSAPAVLDLVDKVFEDEDAARGLSFDGHKVDHYSARQGQAGSVVLWPKEEPTEDDGEDDPWYVPIDHVSADSPLARVAVRIADQVRDWIASGETLPAQGRPVRPGDILILVQRRRRMAELLVAALKERGIPVSGRDRMVLPDQLVIQDLIALGRLTLLPDDDLNTATVLKGPLIGLNEDQLFALAYDRDGSLLDALRNRQGDDPAFRAAWDRIAAWRARADFVPPFEFFSGMLHADGGRKALLARLGPDAADPIDDFLAAALDFESDHVPSMEGFLHWLEIGNTEVKRDLEQGRNEVRVMTVHGAKGLQAEIVFLADACSVPAPQTDDKIRWLDDDDLPVWPGYAGNETEALQAIKQRKRDEALQEYRRLLYVALTRAKDRLYVTGFTNKKQTRESSWYDMVEHAMRDLGQEATEPDGRSQIRYEKPQTAEPDGGGVEERAGDTDTPLPDWALTLPAGEPLPPKPLSPSRPDDEEPPARSPLDTDDGQRFKRGNVVHALMQTLPELPPDGRRDAAHRYIARPAHGFDAAAQAALTDEVMAVLEHPEFAPLFAPGSRAEVPVTGTIETADGPRVISGQIDRLVITPDNVLIVDFKTNRPPPKRAEDVAPLYLKQMATYRAALRQIFPGREVRAFLLWTDGTKCMELPDELLAPHAP
ncbi:MAG: double-strand break repair helicase AddA [Rhodospirillales bacterium]|nr:double-strand break repair helicase AddA [Rhodospirillales bacterium]MBO6785384.1 double-strand break repair helicase AddA [Rhodospirillales bacterium]